MLSNSVLRAKNSLYWLKHLFMPVLGACRGMGRFALFCLLMVPSLAMAASSNPPKAPVSESVKKDIASPQASPLTLSDALQTALDSNPVIKQVESEKERAAAGVKSAISAFLPKLDLDFSLARSNNPVFAFGSKLDQAAFTMEDFQLDSLNDPEYRTNWQTRFRLVQPIFNKGREYIGYKVATAMEGMASMQKQSATQKVLFNVEQAYFQVLLAREAIEVMDAALKTAREHEKLARKRYEAGLVLKSDVLSATVQRTDMERQRLDTMNQYRIAQAALDRAMGVSQDRCWKLEPVELESVVSDRELGWWIETAAARRPELNVVRKQVEVADYRKKGAELKFLPAVNFMGMYQQDTDNPGRFGGDSWTFMTTATFNIFNGLGDRAGLAEASAARKSAQEELENSKARIEFEVRQAFYSYQTALKQLEVARAAVAQAEESMQILKNRYDSGMALMVELLAADTVLKEQMLKQARARYDALLSRARLELSAGVLGSGISSGEDEQQ